MSEFTVQTKEKRVFLGLDGEEFNTEAEALWSFGREKLAELLGDASEMSDYDCRDAAEALREAKADVIRWLDYDVWKLAVDSGLLKNRVNHIR
jgi:hypothetical protein